MGIRYFIYARKSSESEDRQIQSIPDQVDRMKRLAGEGEHKLHIVEIYTEQKSAKAPGNRPVFEEMLKRIEVGDAEGILCWQLNRLSRNPIDSGRVQWMLQNSTIKLIQTIEREYRPEDNALLFSVESGMANQYIQELRRNAVRGMQSKLEKGWYPGSAPIGYLNVGEQGDATITRDPARFDAIRKMWDLMLTGVHTPPQILKIVNDEWGFMTRKTKRTGGKQLSRSNLYKMFTNPFYAGNMEFNGQTYPGKHEPMITWTEYDRVQMLLGRKGKPRPKKHTFAFTGFIRCGECGCLITAETKRKVIKGSGEVRGYTYYHCTRRRPDIECSQRTNIRVDRLEAMIVDMMSRYTILPEFRDWALEVLRENHEAEVEARNKIYETQQRRIVAAQRELDNLVGMRIRDLINDEGFVANRDELHREIVRLQAELRETESRAEKWVDLAEKGFNFATHARQAFINGDMETKKTILMALGQNPTIKDGNLSIQANEWLQPIAESYHALETEYQGLEPSQVLDNEARIGALASVRDRWRARQDSNLRPTD